MRRGLQSDLIGATFASIQVLHARSIRRQPGGAAELAAGLSGRTVRSANRRGKYLWLEVEESGPEVEESGPEVEESGPEVDVAGPAGQESGPEVSVTGPGRQESGWDPDDSAEALVVHLGMSGQLRLISETDSDRHARIDFALADGRTLRFRDQRTFGWVVLGGMTIVDGQRVPDVVGHVAPDPFESTFDMATLLERMSCSRAAIKRVLLDQTVISGIGNIYADEALWRARVHHSTPARELSRDQAQSVIVSATSVMAEAIESGGTSFDALYVDVTGDKGWFERSLAVYGREDEPCPRCGEPIRREKFTNRSSFVCLNCVST